MDSTPKITPWSWLMIAMLGLTWGGTFLVIELALSGGMPPFWLAASRITFAALLMCIVWGVLGFPLFAEPVSGKNWCNLLIISALSSAVPFTLLAWGQQYVSSGFAGVSMAAVALIVLPLAHFALPGERMTPRKVAGFLVGFVGVVILIGAQAFQSSGAALETPGRLACVGAAACYAVGSIMLRRLPKAHPIGLTTLPLLIGAGIILPTAWLVEGPPTLPSSQTLAVVAFLGLVPTAAANCLRVVVVRSAGPVFMTLVNYQVPVWSVLLGSLFLGEALPSALLLAMSLILSGVALSQYGALKRLFSR
ncbi:DMT family transporter [Sulfitobacter sp.]